jgi:molybdate transport system ATP-binding protein
MQHWAIYTETHSPARDLISRLMGGPHPAEFEALEGKTGALFSTLEIARFIEEEVRHDRKILTQNTTQSLQSMSSGERKKVLLNYLLGLNPDYLVLDNPFDNLDAISKLEIVAKISALKSSIHIIQLLSRKADLFPFIDQIATWQNGALNWQVRTSEKARENKQMLKGFKGSLPPPIKVVSYPHKELIKLQNVSVAFGNKQVLNQINWTIRPGDFWELKGKNGSGKTTLLSMITGDNPKAYGQDLYLFGHKKGSGESVWDIKKQIGYVTPALTDRFRGYHTLQNMLISGLVDSIGLYITPTESQIRLANAWLTLLGMAYKKDAYFHDLSKGEQRLIMCARAMIKHPLLLILDEPTADLDDEAAALVVALVNKMGNESKTSIVFVSHREEPDLQPGKVYALEPGIYGSVGKKINL